MVLYEHTAPQLDPDAVELLTPDSVPGQWGESVPRPAASDSLDLRLKTLRLWGVPNKKPCTQNSTQNLHVFRSSGGLEVSNTYLWTIIFI